jgi:competence protein ComEA
VYLNISNSFNTVDIIDFTKFEKEIDVFNEASKRISDSIKQEKESKYKSSYTTTNIEQHKAEYFNFNPNNLPDADWKRLGLSEKQIKTIKNYESKGGKFKRKEDVKKMYCIKEEQYNLLEPFILIPEPVSAFSAENKTKNNLQISKAELSAKPLPIVIELNSADSLTLLKVKGIGPFYAKNIIKYRVSLGGFVAKEQLMELWKFDSIKFEAVKNLVIVDAVNIKKININMCTAAELKHPYLTWNIANAIVNYRAKHGKYRNLDDIKKTDLVNDETYRKIAPYLVIE